MTRRHTVHTLSSIPAVLKDVSVGEEKEAGGGRRGEMQGSKGEGREEGEEEGGGSDEGEERNRWMNEGQRVV